MVLDGAPGQAREQLEETIFPFWFAHGLDRRYGGFHTCFDNRGRARLSTDKFTWSQGRFVWLLARAAALGDRGHLDIDAGFVLSEAERGAQFLLTHAIRPDASCWFRLTRQGAPVVGDEDPARSVYADCFVVMGLAELARVTGDAHWLDRAEPVLTRARADILAGTAPTPPYEVPAGYAAFGPRMILLNTLLVHVTAACELRGAASCGDLSRWLAETLDLVMSYRLADGTFAEMVPKPAGHDDTLLARHRVPGHAVEGLWVALECMDLLGEHRHRQAVLDSVPALCELGWDDEHGGLLRYTDADGAQRPRGSDGHNGHDGRSPYEELVVRTWDTKLWWVHSEAAVTTAIAGARYGSDAAASWFRRIWEYTLQTFPGGDDGAEWIQIRDRSGSPLDEVVALPVKDPFHLTRNLMQIAEIAEIAELAG